MTSRGDVFGGSSRSALMGSACALLVAGFLLAAAGTAFATFPGRNGDLVAVVQHYKQPDERGAVVRLGSNGTRAETTICQRFPGDCLGISGAAVSPDGRRIAAVSLQDQPAGSPDVNVLQVIRLGGGGWWRIPLPAAPRPDLPQTSYGDVTWSPDGSRWLIERVIGDGAGRAVPLGLTVIGRDGADQGQLVEGDATQADWSPKGDLAFVRGDALHGQGTLWVRRTDGTLKQLSSPGAEHPSWSPDGRRIAFSHGCDHLDRGPRCGIYVIPAAGGVPRLVARRADWPVWSPDGRKIAFLRAMDLFVGNAVLFVADLKTRRVRRVTKKDEYVNSGWSRVVSLDWTSRPSRRAR